MMEKPEFNKWFADNAEELRYNYDLSSDSIVVDIGAYKGEFSKRIFEIFGCRVYAFEPVKHYFDIASAVLRPYIHRILVSHSGVAGNTHIGRICINGDESSSHKIVAGGCCEESIFWSVDSVIHSLGLKEVDLVKINIEGGEYDLLEAMISKGIVERFRNIQVQFHNFMEGAPERRRHIQEALSRTHEPTYMYNWVWENWRRR